MITTDSNEKIMLNIYKIWNRLKIIQNKSIRAALNVPHFTSTTYIHQITNMPHIRSYITAFTERALIRSHQLEDTVTEKNLISSILEKVVTWLSSIPSNSSIPDFDKSDIQLLQYFPETFC
ncbi:unnamed protein product [Adineta steineri]|uniref:Uncharacterized protein n=1 Tax=Adineta steineri TaxID=433720 RepID=A0A816G583_9BILA|nr:unnamed protein product [Adineta steineri]CAF1669370.1 unnamed protein product [Adineta steineri]